MGQRAPRLKMDKVSSDYKTFLSADLVCDLGHGQSRWPVWLRRESPLRHGWRGDVRRRNPWVWGSGSGGAMGGRVAATCNAKSNADRAEFDTVRERFRDRIPEVHGLQPLDAADLRSYRGQGARTPVDRASSTRAGALKHHKGLRGNPRKPLFTLGLTGGRCRARTSDPLLVRQVLLPYKQQLTRV